jgi:hypothetical protein
MSVADYIKELSASRQGDEQSQVPEASSALKDLEEVESTLREIGVSLEPRFFDISLTARIGAPSRR